MLTRTAIDTAANLVPRAHVSFGQRQDTELWNNQFPESKMTVSFAIVGFFGEYRVHYFYWQ